MTIMRGKCVRIIALLFCVLYIMILSSCRSNIHGNNEIGSSGTESSFSMSPSKKSNQQIKADTLLERQISGAQYWLYNYSFTNGNECIDKVYIFNFNPDTLSLSEDGGYNEAYENNYLKKYSYLYLDGKKDSIIQVQKYTRDDIADQPWYCDQYYYIKSSEYKDKIVKYQSYEIGIDGTIFDNEYFHYTYDDNGRLTETMDDVGYKNYFYYDEQGVLTGRTFDVTESNYDEKSYSYEMDNENIVKVYVHNPKTGNTLSRYEYEYDSANHIIKETVYNYYKNEEKRVSSTTVYSYDNNSNISKITEEKYDSDTDSYKKTSKEYFYNDNNNISKIVTDNGKSIEYTVLVYTDQPESYTELYYWKLI